MNKRQLGPCVTFFPQPTTLVSSVDGAGKANLMTASWASIVSKTPPTMAVALNQGRLTYRNIQETGCFVVNMVPASLAVEADYCGLKSGRDEDKIAAAGLNCVPASKVAAPLVAESPLNVECRVSGEVELGEYRLILGEILEIHAAEQAFDAEGRGAAKSFDPLVYLGGIRQYWSLGEKAAEAYRDGVRLFEKK
ncbi:flavin reductase [Desulfuromonas versatilis]|uniref:Flavin reductase n=1 Tax=Desulfuromonas versatilis TaxID=2802975 RepID=A0ABM8HTT4_9BACT|nr:flavin reductase family protein [Desulfuromonas versatilis]BCR05328.1 flavin reductase [Desulfuromonas versatilis]